MLVEGGWAGEGEIGGRVWGIEVAGEDVNAAPAGSAAKLWFGPELELTAVERGRRVFRTHDPETEREIGTLLAREPYRERLGAHDRGSLRRTVHARGAE